MARKTEYERGWYDCYKAVRGLMSGAMKDMVDFRIPSGDVKTSKHPVSAQTKRRTARGNGKERGASA